MREGLIAWLDIFANVVAPFLLWVIVLGGLVYIVAHFVVKGW